MILDTLPGRGSAVGQQEATPALTPAASPSAWISVKDRLPERNTEVLTVLSDRPARAADRQAHVGPFYRAADPEVCGAGRARS